MKKKKEFHVFIEKDSDGYFVATIPSLPGCHTQAKTVETLMKRIQEAAELCLEVRGKNIEKHEFIGIQKIAI